MRTMPESRLRSRGGSTALSGKAKEGRGVRGTGVLRGGMVGLGNVAVHGHAPAYRRTAGLTITAIFDPLAERRTEGVRHFRGASCCSSIEELLECPGLDFVDISSPPSSHAGQVGLALRKGKHVLCEKPLVLTGREFSGIDALRRREDRVVFTAHNWRYAPILARTRELVREGAVGPLERVTYRVERERPSVAVNEGPSGANWRLDPAISGGGILVDHGWHAFYTIRDWFGRMPTWVECQLENRKHPGFDVEDTARVRIGYGDGVAELFFTWAGTRRRNEAFIRGTRGSLELRDDELRVCSPGRERSYGFEEGLSSGSHHPDWYADTLAAFEAEIRGAGAGGGNLAEAGECVALLDLCRASDAASGARQWVELSRPLTSEGWG